MQITRLIKLTEIFSGESYQGVHISKQQLVIETLIVFAIAFSVFTWAMIDLHGLKSFDSYYHLFMADQILDHGPWVDVSWLPLTVLGNAGPDQHWLFHVLLIPFTFFDDSFKGLIWAAITMGAAVPAAINVAGRLLGIPYSPLFSLLATCAATTLPFRILMLRAQNVAIIFMMLGIVTMVKKRNVALGVITFLFMQSYQAAVIMGVFVIGYLTLSRLNKQDVNLRPLTAVVIGGSLGIILSPWFPENINYLVFHTLFKTQQSGLAIVGTEWFPLNWFSVARTGWIANFLLVGGITVTGFAIYLDKTKRVKLDSQLFLAVTFLFLIMFHDARRFVEYYAPFAVLTSGLLLRDAGLTWRSPISARITATIMTIFLVVGTWNGISTIRKPPFNEPGEFKEMAEFIQKHGAPNDMIFNSNWDDFVLLVPKLPMMHFVSGLDGNYLAYGDPKRFLVWYNLVLDTEKYRGQDIGRIIAGTFNAKWAIIHRSWKTLGQGLLDSQYAKLRVADEKNLLFEIQLTNNTNAAGNKKHITSQ